VPKVIWVISLLAVPFLAQAAPSSQAPGSQGGALEASKTGASSRLARPIDFWGTGAAADPGKPPPGQGLELGPGRIILRETVWAQPIRTPDGNWMLYVPPKPILDFLENPTEETGKAYLAWKSEQAEKLGRAMSLLARLKEAGPGAPKGEDAPEASDPGQKAAPRPGTLIYFKKPSCPHCVSQDAVLALWLPKHPDLRLQVVLPDEQPELWKAYAVRGTPTLVLRSGVGKGEVLVGLQSDAQLEAAISRSVGPGVHPSQGDDKERSR
jgi:hypothetical protein